MEQMATIKHFLYRINEFKLDDIVKNAQLAEVRESLIDAASASPVGDQALVRNSKEITEMLNKFIEAQSTK